MTLMDLEVTMKSKHKNILEILLELIFMAIVWYGLSIILIFIFGG